MKALGPGVRVYIGYEPPMPRELPVERASLCTTGTIIDGPYPPETIRCEIRNLYNESTSWQVDVDDVPGETYIAEQLLFPIDDDDDDPGIARERREEITA